MVDLDGTLVLGNSFHEFLGRLWQHGGLAARRALLVIVICRALSRGVRARQLMKLRAVKLYSRLDPTRAEAVLAATVDACLAQISAPVLSLVRSRADAGWRVVVASAAPAAYAEVLAARLGFDDCLASPMTSDRPDDELIGERKAAAVRAWLGEEATMSAGGSVPLMVMSDHRDDLPLMALADEVALQGSAGERAAIEAQLGQPVAFSLDPLEKQEDGRLWLWFDDRPSGPHDIWEVTTILSKHRYALLYAGEGTWQRVLPGSSLAAGVQRSSCPRPPSMRQRVGIVARRRIVRDRLGIFH
ncbi:HAD family hydrolase [Streptomyces sp. NPDC056653]|uniref:HAD family hydrolase n=1 Tax=Streptomyces sp. NPDC056653 TaxID=3345894 RepID=UPI00368347E8